MKFKIEYWKEKHAIRFYVWHDWQERGITIPSTWPEHWGFWETWYDGPHYICGLGPFALLYSSSTPPERE